MWDELQPRLSSCTVPIGWTRGNEIGIYGTGTLVRVADVSFLVTAHHVLERARHEGYDLQVFDSPPGSPALALCGLVSGSPEHDVVIIELEQETVAALPNRSYLSVHDADRHNRRPRQGIHVVYGYPASQAEPDDSRTKLYGVPFSVLGLAYTGSTNSFNSEEASKNYDSNRHILIDGDPADRTSSAPNALPFPSSLNGMSGCSIWQAHYPGLSPKFWTPADAVIVGVQTGVRKNGTVIQGTRWWVVDRVIREAYPELAGPLDLHIPMSGT